MINMQRSTESNESGIMESLDRSNLWCLVLYTSFELVHVGSCWFMLVLLFFLGFFFGESTLQWQDSTSTTPFFILSPGADPVKEAGQSKEVVNFVDSLCFVVVSETSREKLRNRGFFDTTVYIW